jgi:type VI secretion system protein ImpH
MENAENKKIIASLKIKSMIVNPYDYEFSKAVHILNKLLKLCNGKLELQSSYNLKIQFKSTVRYANPASAIDKIELKESKKSEYGFQPVVWVNFLGVAGIQGPLSLVYTERVFRNSRAGDKAFASFLDIFNNRLVSLSYDANKCIPGYCDVPPQNSPIGELLKSFGGIDPSDNDNCSQNKLTREKYLITYKTMFWQRIRSVANLKQMLCSFFQEEVDISEFHGGFYDVCENEVTKIGANGNLLTLGYDAVLGSRVWRQNSQIHIIVKNVDGESYETFNPHKNGENLYHLISLCEEYVPVFTSTRFFIQIDSSFKKPTILGRKHNLGFNTWLGSKITNKESPRLIH